MSSAFFGAQRAGLHQHELPTGRPGSSRHGGCRLRGIAWLDGVSGYFLSLRWHSDRHAC